jgi:phage-related protein
MIVNNIDILTKYNLILTKKDIQNGEIINCDDWLDNSIDPIQLQKQKIKYAIIKVDLFVDGADEDEVLIKISNIIQDCKEGSLKFNDSSYYYFVSLTNSSNDKIIFNAYTLHLEFKASYKYKDYVTETMNLTTAKTITVQGNTETPAIVEITPTSDLIDLVINGFGKDSITINNLVAGKKVILDGESGLVTVYEVNKYGDVDMWDFPTLQPGPNTITCSRSTANITIKYKPRWI